MASGVNRNQSTHLPSPIVGGRLNPPPKAGCMMPASSASSIHNSGDAHRNHNGAATPQMLPPSTIEVRRCVGSAPDEILLRVPCEDPVTNEPSILGRSLLPSLIMVAPSWRNNAHGGDAVGLWASLSSGFVRVMGPKRVFAIPLKQKAIRWRYVADWTAVGDQRYAALRRQPSLECNDIVDVVGFKRSFIGHIHVENDDGVWVQRYEQGGGFALVSSAEAVYYSIEIESSRTPHGEVLGALWVAADVSTPHTGVNATQNAEFDLGASERGGSTSHNAILHLRRQSDSSSSIASMRAPPSMTSAPPPRSAPGAYSAASATSGVGVLNSPPQPRGQSTAQQHPPNHRPSNPPGGHAPPPPQAAIFAASASSDDMSVRALPKASSLDRLPVMGGTGAAATALPGGRNGNRSHATHAAWLNGAATVSACPSFSPSVNSSPTPTAGPGTTPPLSSTGIPPPMLSTVPAPNPVALLRPAATASRPAVRSDAPTAAGSQASLVAGGLAAAARLRSASPHNLDLPVNDDDVGLGVIQQVEPNARHVYSTCVIAFDFVLFFTPKGIVQTPFMPQLASIKFAFVLRQGRALISKKKLLTVVEQLGAAGGAFGPGSYHDEERTTHDFARAILQELIGRPCVLPAWVTQPRPASHEAPVAAGARSSSTDFAAPGEGLEAASSSHPAPIPLMMAMPPKAPSPTSVVNVSAPSPIYASGGSSGAASSRSNSRDATPVALSPSSAASPDLTILLVTTLANEPSGPMASVIAFGTRVSYSRAGLTTTDMVANMPWASLTKGTRLSSGESVVAVVPLGVPSPSTGGIAGRAQMLDLVKKWNQAGASDAKPSAVASRTGGGVPSVVAPVVCFGQRTFHMRDCNTWHFADAFIKEVLGPAPPASLKRKTWIPDSVRPRNMQL